MKRVLLFALVLGALCSVSFTAVASASVAPVVCGSEGCGSGGGTGRPYCGWGNFGQWWHGQWCGLFSDEQTSGAQPYWHF